MADLPANRSKEPPKATLTWDDRPQWDSSLQQLDHGHVENACFPLVFGLEAGDVPTLLACTGTVAFLARLLELENIPTHVQMFLHVYPEASM